MSLNTYFRDFYQLKRNKSVPNLNIQKNDTDNNDRNDDLKTLLDSFKTEIIKDVKNIIAESTSVEEVPNEFNEVMSEPKIEFEEDEISENCIPNPNLALGNYGIKSLKRIKDFRAIYGAKYNPNAGGTVVQFLLTFVSHVNQISPPFSPAEYNNLLISSFSERDKAKLLHIIGTDSLNELAPSKLHKAILIVFGENLPCLEIKSNFYSFSPRNLEEVDLSSVVSEISRLGKLGKIDRLEIFEKILRVIPNEYSGHLRAKFISDRSIYGSSHPPPTPFAILNFFEPNILNINMALKRMYSKQVNKYQVNKINDTVVKNNTGFCLHCLKTNHSTDSCFNKLNCILCGQKSHSPPTCPSYPDSQPLTFYCKHCLTLGLKLHHPSAVCKNRKGSNSKK